MKTKTKIGKKKPLTDRQKLWRKVVEFIRPLVEKHATENKEGERHLSVLYVRRDWTTCLVCGGRIGTEEGGGECHEREKPEVTEELKEDYWPSPWKGRK